MNPVVIQTHMGRQDGGRLFDNIIHALREIEAHPDKWDTEEQKACLIANCIVNNLTELIERNTRRSAA